MSIEILKIPFAVCNFSFISSLVLRFVEPESALFIHFRIVSCFMTEIWHTTVDNDDGESTRSTQFNLKMSRNFFFPRFHVQVFASGTYLLSAIVVDSIFVIDLPSFSRLNELKTSVFGKDGMQERNGILDSAIAVVCEAETMKVC
jgi:hypothetical protein